jgi:hypothetical protein
LKSLVKNIFTSIVAITLLIGSSGFQVYKHTCSVHKLSSVSLTGTPVCEKDHQALEETDDCCKAEVEEITEPSCCGSGLIDESNPVSITSQKIECCISSIESVQLQDNLFPPAVKKVVTVEPVISSSIVIEKEILQAEQNLVLQNIDLPPPKFGKQLLQTIHQLKIDTLIC